MADWLDGWTAGTADDLAKDARDLGLRCTPRTVTDHVEVGLLAPPLPRKSTQRGSDRRIFPPEQRRLFYEINCAKLRSPLPRVPHHTIIPIILHIWLTWDSVVTKEQARRALRTHARHTGISSSARRRATAGRVVSQFAAPEATTQQRRAAACWMRLGEETRNPRWDAVADALHVVANPWSSRGCSLIRGFGPPQAPMTTDQMVGLWEATWATTQKLENEEVGEALLSFAREEHRSDWADYQQKRRLWQTQAGQMADIFDIPDDQEEFARQQVNNFVTVVGAKLGLVSPALERARAREARRGGRIVIAFGAPSAR